MLKDSTNNKPEHSFELKEILNITEVINIISSFNEFTGLFIGITDTEGNFIIRYGEQTVCRNFHMINPQSDRECQYSLNNLSDPNLKDGEIAIKTCRLGLQDAITPLYDHQRLLGYIVSGGVFFNQPDIKLFEEQAKKYHYRLDHYLSSLKEVPVMSQTQLKGAVKHIALVITALIYERKKLFESWDDCMIQQRLIDAEKRIEKQFAELYRINRELQTEIQNRKFAEDALKENELKYFTVLSSITEGVLFIEHNGKVLTANDSALQILGMGETLPESGDYTRLFPEMYDENSTPIPPGEDPITTSLKHSSGLFDTIIGIKDTDGMVKWLSINTIPLFRDNETNAYALVLSFSNITKRKQIEDERQKLIKMLYESNKELSDTLKELKIAQKQIITQEKLASLGSLTAGIAHEIHNPLNFVNNFSELSLELVDEIYKTLEDEFHLPVNRKATILDDLEILKQNIDRILFHSKRVNRIINAMLLHTRNENSYEFDVVDVNHITEEYLNLAYHGIHSSYDDFKVRIISHYDENAGSFQIVPQNVSRVLLNIFHNAFSFMHEKWLKNRDYEPELTVSTHGEQDNIYILIHDNGIGIPYEIQDKIFNPFFTTKRGEKGMGLGLSISFDIVTNEHNGFIEVESVPGEYAEFKLTFPRVNIRNQ